MASLQNTYRTLVNQIKLKIARESDLIANLANVTAFLNTLPHVFWVGFYLVKNDELVLGPFQGTPATTRISFDDGVCGYCVCQRKTVIVPDVHQFEGHIACDPLSKSEIVVPIFNKDNDLCAVLDIDSTELNAFNEVDQKYLEKIAELLRDQF